MTCYLVEEASVVCLVLAIKLDRLGFMDTSLVSLLEGNGSMKSIQVNQQPFIKLAGLVAGAKYRLRVYSHEHHSISSDFVTFETGRGEG